jgi:Leucine-rich repeat (LRR) protein
MFSDQLDLEKPDGLVIQPATGLISLPEGNSPALSEIISRSLAHIQESKALATLHRIGECELYGPDYRLVCAWAEELQVDPNTFLEKLLWCRNPIYKRGEVDDYDHPYIWFKEDGRFEHLEFPPSDYFPDLHFPKIKGLKLESLDWSGKEPLDLDLFPELNHFMYHGSEFELLELFRIPKLTSLYCANNQLTKLDLSAAPNLRKLSCQGNQLTSLDLSQVTDLEELDCSRNKLQEIDIRPLLKLHILRCDEDVTIIQRPDQNF